VKGSCENGREPSCLINSGKFLDQLNDYQLLKNDSVPWSLFGYLYKVINRFPYPRRWVYFPTLNVQPITVRFSEKLCEINEANKTEYNARGVSTENVLYLYPHSRYNSITRCVLFT
jgi:hypothetical protein